MLVSAGTDDDELFDIVQALARVSLKRLTLDNGVYLFEYNPAQLDNVAALMRPCRDQPVHYDTVASGAFASRWRVQRRKRQQAKLDAPDHEGLLPV